MDLDAEDDIVQGEDGPVEQDDELRDVRDGAAGPDRERIWIRLIRKMESHYANGEGKRGELHFWKHTASAYS